MRKMKKQIDIMIIFIFISGTIVVLCEYDNFFMLRRNVVSIMSFLDGKRDIISNISIGILCSSFIALIGYMFEYTAEKKKSKKDLFYLYKYIRVSILPKIGKEIKKEIVKTGVEDDRIYKMREVLENYKSILEICDKFFKILSKKMGYEVSVLDLRFCPTHLGMAYVLREVDRYYLFMTSLYYRFDVLLNTCRECNKMIKKLDRSVISSDENTQIMLEECLRRDKILKEELKNIYNNLKIFRKEALAKDIINKCRYIDIKVDILKYQ